MTILLRVILFPWMILLLLGGFPGPAIAQAQTSDSICYMQTTNGTVIDLRGLCEKADPNRVPNQDQPTNSRSTPAGNGGNNSRSPQTYGGRVSYPTPPNVYNVPAMRDFDQRLYGS